ncbi:hypothetical protein [Shewanella sp. SR44-3]|uniref:hypothetical protein n=3 Tax=unclassified Shewanella TaxID=196818 RepID=UPI0015FCFE3E|nr:hypothetical protein [Shewanella sp. SR44-3]MBB1270475.1 hypothetical protein [Shewanella sp. SR44-3]
MLTIQAYNDKKEANLANIETHNQVKPTRLTHFRSEYRRGIKANYHGCQHMLMVLFIASIMVITACLALKHVRLIELWIIPFTLMAANLIEYVAHRYLGHKMIKFKGWALGRLFYQRHTLEHHRFFDQHNMDYQSTRDWRVILFPSYLIVGICLVGLMPLMLIGYSLDSATAANVIAAAEFAPYSALNLASLASISAIFCYLSYEALHFSYHLPKAHPLRLRLDMLPWWRRLRQLHVQHHHPRLMGRGNFNVTWPLCDYLFNSLYWQVNIKKIK